MTSLLQIRGLADESRRVLKARAAARGQSLNSYLLDMIQRDVARPTVGEVLARASERAEHADSSALSVILEARQQRDDLHSDRAPR